MRPRLKRMILIAPLAILGILLFMAIGGWIVLLLWNWLLPPLFGWPSVTFGQALGLLVLCRILFGGMGRHGYRRSHCRQRTPDERDRLRQAMRERFGFGPPTSEGKEI